MKPLQAAMILAGGYSTRMKRDKAELVLEGKTLIQYQADRLKAMGFEEILVCGYAKPVEGARNVEDIVPHRGPLSGIHAGLCACTYEKCLVLSVDMPLVPEEVIRALVQKHTHGALILEHEGYWEPLCGVYDTSLARAAGELLKGEDTSVRALLKTGGYETMEYTGDPFLLTNSNIPEEFEAIVRYLSSHS